MLAAAHIDGIGHHQSKNKNIFAFSDSFCFPFTLGGSCLQLVSVSLLRLLGAAADRQLFVSLQPLLPLPTSNCLTATYSPATASGLQLLQQVFAQMKKKRQIMVNDPAMLDIDLKSLIHENSLFFDKLIELIPARFYLPVDEKEKKWFPGLSKDEKALSKKETRENIKKARRDRLDPEKSSATTLDLLMKNLEKEKLNDESDDEEVEINPMMSGLEGDGQSATYEDLRQRLQRKIVELRGNRNTSEKKKNKKKGMQERKRKRDSELENKNSAQNSSMEKGQKDAEEAAKELKFSHVKLEKEELGKKKKRKLSKVKELEKAKELEEAKKNPEKGDIITKHSWKTAVSRAAGNKVHDNPKLLKESMKKETKRHQKNSEKWKERIENQQKMKAERQQTRSQNIADRIQRKKMRRIAKREKKLLRPGFEGRKEGYINEGEVAQP